MGAINGTFGGFFGGGGAAAGLDPTLYLLRSGGTMQGPLILYGDPTQPREAVTLEYLETQLDNTLQDAKDAVQIGLVMPAEFTVTGSPAGYDGTFTVGLEDQAANMVFAGPVSGVAAPPSFRALVAADISDLDDITDLYLPLTGGSLTGSLDITGDLSATGKLEVGGDASVTGKIVVPTIDSGSTTPVQFIPDLEADQIVLNPDIQTWGTVQAALTAIDDTAFLDRDIAVPAGTDLNTLTKPGGYLWNAMDQATYVNGPSMRSTAYGTLSVIKSNMYVIQRLVIRTTDWVNGIWERWINPSMNAYDPWRRAADERNVTVEEIANQNSTQPAWIRVAAMTVPTTLNANRQLRIKVNNRSAGGFNISTWFLTLRVSTSGVSDPLTQYTNAFSIRKMDLASTQALEFGYVRNYTGGTLDIYAKATTTLVSLVVSKYDIADASFTTILPDGLTWGTTEPADGANLYTVIPQSTFLHDGSGNIAIAQASPTGTNATRYIRIASYPAPTTTSSAAIQIDLQVNARMNSATPSSTYLVSFALIRSALPYTISAGSRRLDLNSAVTVEFGYVKNDTDGTFDVYAKTTQNYPNLIASKWTLNSYAANLTLFPAPSTWNATVPSDGTNDYTVIDQQIVALLTSSGHLGINTTAPQTPLDVRGVAAGDPVCSLARLVGDNNFVLRTANGGPTNTTGSEACRIGLMYHIGAIWNAGIRFLRGGGSANGFMALDTSGVERMRITGQGYVGVANDGTPPFTGSGDYGHMIIGPTAAGGSSTAYGWLTLCSANDAVAGSLAYANYAIAAAEKRIAQISGTAETGVPNSGTLMFYTWNAGVVGLPKMVINSEGYVGIGNNAQAITRPIAPAGYMHLTVGPIVTSSYYGFITTCGSTTQATGAPCGVFAFANYSIAGAEKRVAEIWAHTDGNIRAGALRFYTWTADGTTHERMRITSAGNVGIGTDATVLPQASGLRSLIVGNAAAATTYGCLALIANTASTDAAVGDLTFANYNITAAEKRLAVVTGRTDGAVNSGALAFYTMSAGVVSAERMRITSAGRVGIAVMAPAYQFQLSTDSAAKPSTNTWTIASDRRTKRNVRRFDGDIEVIRQLNPTVSEYNGKAGTPDGARVVSFDADELRKVVPEAVSRVRAKLDPADDDEVDVDGINTHEIFFHMLCAVQQLDRRLARLEGANPQDETPFDLGDI